MWACRLAQRAPEDVDPAIRSAVAEMVLRSYAMQAHGWEAGAREEDVLDPPVNLRLHEIRCPTLVIVGEHDVTDMRSIAAHIAHTVDNARLVEVAGTAHLPSLERPDEVNALLLAFLNDR